MCNCFTQRPLLPGPLKNIWNTLGCNPTLLLRARALYPLCRGLYGFFSCSFHLSFSDSCSSSIIAQLAAASSGRRQGTPPSPPSSSSLSHLTMSAASPSCATPSVLSTRALSNSQLYRDYVNLPPPPPYPGTAASTSSHHDHSTSSVSVGSNGRSKCAIFAPILATTLNNHIYDFTYTFLEKKLCE